jgi:non-ribosomal peptide synthase protein (TIGR01720 family)
LLLVAHHLVVDAVSWRVLLDDLAAAYAQALRGDPPALAAEACGPFALRRRLAAWFSDGVRERERAYWAAVTAHAGELFAPAAAAQPSVPATLVRELSGAETRALLAARIAGTSVQDLLLAAFGRALCVEARRPTVLVDVEGHGRDAFDDVDLSRSVGWFTTLYPVALACGASDDRAALIDAAQRATRAVPDGGIGFGLLQWNDVTVAPARHTDVSFNYLGAIRADAPHGLVRGLAREHAGATVADDLPRRYRLACDAAEIGGRFVMRYTYDASLAAAVAAVADRALATLRALIADDDVDALLDDLDLSELGE